LGISSVLTFNTFLESSTKLKWQLFFASFLGSVAVRKHLPFAKSAPVKFASPHLLKCLESYYFNCTFSLNQCRESFLNGFLLIIRFYSKLLIPDAYLK